MPLDNIVVPVNGDGPSVDLTSYGFEKTVIVSGIGGPIDSFDALLMVDNGSPVPISVGRVKGATTALVPAWIPNVFLRRLDDGANAPFPAQVTIQSQDSRAALLLHDTFLTPTSGDQEIDVRDMSEPLTVTCHANYPLEAEVLVFGKSVAGDLAPIGNLSIGNSLLIDSGVDVNFLVFRLLSYNDPAQTGSDVTLQVYGKNEKLLSGKPVALGLIEFVNAGANIISQGASSSIGFSGVINNPGAGIYEILLNGIVSGAGVSMMPFVQIQRGNSAAARTAHVIAYPNNNSDGVFVEILDAAGVNVNPGTGIVVSIRVDN